VTDIFPIDTRRSSNLRIAITGTVVVHAILLLLLAWLMASEAARKLWEQAHQPPKEKVKEEEVLLFPEQFLTPLPPKPPKPEVYIRTAQNQAADTAPKNPAFIADRNTHAATVKAPSPDATEPMPSMDGLKLPTREMADRDYKNGDLKDDSRPKSQPAVVAMLAPQPPVPPVPPQAKPPAPAPQPQVAPQAVAKAVTESTVLTKMMDEVDKELAKVDKNRLPLEVKKPELADAPMKTTDEPPKTETQVPTKAMVSEAVPQETLPQKPIPKALPVLDDEPVTRTTRNQDPNAFTPFTRTAQTKGTISNRGSEASVDAEETPKGRYIRQVTGQVEKKWHIYRLLRRDGVTYGSLQVVFYVNKKGKVESLRVINSKESNPILTDFTLQAIKDAEIPPMPADVIPTLPMNDQERLKVEYNVLIY
jgi:outer membrane biosynthesis protein TonB